MSNDLNSPRDFVQSGWDYFRAQNNEWVALSRQAIQELSEFTVSPLVFDIQIRDDIYTGDFVRPVLGLSNDVGTVSVVVPEMERFSRVGLRNLPDMPDEPDFGRLTYRAPRKPDVDLPSEPTDTDVVLDPIVVPEAPAYTMPEHPTLLALNLPDPPDITFEEFAGVRPVFDITLPDRAFPWQEVAYSSTLLDAVKAHLTSMMAGGLGLPPAIEQAIFDRGRARADLLSIKRVQETAEELGARGLYEPSGHLARRLDEAREAGRAEAAGLNRDITIRSAEIEVESIRFALGQAGALETALIQQYGTTQQRALEATKIASDIQFAYLEGQIAIGNLETELFKADAQVFRDLLQAKIAKADVYKTQIEAQKVIGDVNESLIRAYVEEIRAIDSLASIYKTEVEAARVKGELNTQRLEQARLRVQVFSERVRGFVAAYDAYKSEVEGELGNLRGYEILGNIFGQRVSAVKVQGDYLIAQNTAELAQQRQEFEVFRLKLEHARTDLAAQIAAIDARLRAIQANTAIYATEAQIATAEAAAKDRSAELKLSESRARAEVALGNINAQITQLDRVGSMYLQELTSRAQIISQLAAATASGVNFGASYSGSLGFSYGKSAGISYGGNAADYAGVPPSLNI